MTIIKRSKLLVFLTASALFLSIPLHSEVLSDQTLKNDIAYYQKTANLKGLNTNDRTYILKRIEEKYDGTEINVTPLKNEFSKLGKKTYSSDKQKTKPAVK